MIKNYARIALMVVGAVASVQSARANLIVNGSFETHDAYNGSGWNYFYGTSGNTVSGWSSATSGVPLEVGNASVYGVIGQDGSAVMELDSTANVRADQTLTGTVGASYTLSFKYAGRANVAQTSTTFDVYWNSVKVASINPGANPPNNVMTAVSYTVTGAANNTLEFRGTGTSESLGALIDDVNLAAVPEPSTYIAGGMLLLPLVVQGLRARRNRN